MCVDLKAVIKQAGGGGGTDSLTVSPCIGNERECGDGRRLEAVASLCCNQGLEQDKKHVRLFRGSLLQLGCRLSMTLLVG